MPRLTQLTIGLFGFVTLSVMGAQFQHKDFTFQYNDQEWDYVPQAVVNANTAKEDVDRAMAEQTVAIIQNKKADEKYHSRFSVVIDPLAKKDEKLKTLEGYEKHAVDFMKSQRFAILGTTRRKIAGTDAVEISAHQRDFGLTFQQLILVKGDNAYLLTGTSRTNKFKDYQKAIDEMANSFKWAAK